MTISFGDCIFDKPTTAQLSKTQRVLRLLDPPIYRQDTRARKRIAPLTVCIAARAGDQLVLASDRLLTAADVQFEPARPKIVGVTHSIYIMTAGDASYLTLVLPHVLGWANRKSAESPDQWLLVRDVVDCYLYHFNEVRAKMAEAAILAPLGLTRETFLSRQQTMNNDLVRRLATAMLEYQVPDCAVIVAGRDMEGTHIFAVDGTSVSALESVGFAAIGAGARHANSQFMLARHAWHHNFADTLLLSYIAKRRSETAPGVGTETDMLVIGPGLGKSIFLGDHVMERLEQEYQRVIAAENGALLEAKTQIARYVDELAAQAEQQAVDVAQQASNIETGGESEASTASAE